MFDTEKFIMEIQIRESIWNSSSMKYIDKEKRRKAWEEVGAVMFRGFDSFRSKKRNELIQELQKKWKHLRDYFVREKNKELQQKVVARKKRRAPFLDLLNEFMHVSKTPASLIRPPPVHQSHTTSPISLEESEDANFENNSINVHRDEPTPKKHHETHSRINNQMKSNLNYETHRSLNNQIQSDLDPNMVFLLSILPEMQTMDERQTFEFKLEVMNLIKKIKYNDPNYCNRPAGTSNDYKQPYHMFGNQNYDVPPNGSNSPVSEHSEEDQSFLPPEICLIEKEEIQEDFSAEEEKIL